MIKFLPKKTILAFHEDQINQYGGNRGVKDKRLLTSTLSRIERKNKNSSDDIFEIAAKYGVALCKNEPFFDGCKRMTLISIYTFLYVNGWRLKAENNELYNTMIGLAKGEITNKELAKFLKVNSESR